MTGRVVLEVVDGPIKGKVFTFEEHDTFVFGRAEDCHARLASTDTTASRHHFILEANPPDARIRDLGSRNGTYVNKVKHGGRAKDETASDAARRAFPQVDLKDGDAIRVGGTHFVVRVEVPTAAQRLPGGVRCTQCGKDVALEVGQRREGDYVCEACRSAAEADPAKLLMRLLRDAAPTRDAGPLGIPGYEIGKRIGIGGMGAVYLARRLSDGATVAVKVMLARVAVDEKSRQVFQREIEVTKSLRHPKIVELLDHGSAGSGFYFVMEFCPGGSVADYADRHGGKLSLAQAGPVLVEALEGLAFAHEKGFVHRDLKPANLLLMSSNGGGVKVSDFGLAKNFEKAGFSGMTATGAFAGTMTYMPREQVINFKFVKPVSDVWSMGATLYTLLTQAPPREFMRGKDPVQVILSEPIVPIRTRDASIPARVAEVIDRALVDDVKQRFQTASEFASALRKVL